MKVQKIYEDALAMVGKTEEGSTYPFMDRVPSLLNPDITVLNYFRDDDNQLDPVAKINDEIELTAKEAQGLSLCLACVMATEINGFPDTRLAALMRQRDQVMGSISTAMEEITEAIRVD